MNSSIKNLATVALLTAVGLAASACTDDGIDDLGTTDVIAKGGTGGGGGGGGGGGTPAPGDIRTTSAAMTCDDGTVLSITLSKGFQSRVELQMVVASAVAAPATGYLEVSLTDATSGAFVNGWGSWPGSLVGGMSVTNLGRTVPVGTSTLDFYAVVHEGNAVTGPALVTCSTQITVVGR